MDKPKFKRDPKRTRERIFKAAETLFAKRGFHGVTIGNVADAAHVNRRMIYVYFGNKVGLYQAVMERAFEQTWLPVLASMEACHGVEQPAVALRTAVLAYFDSLASNPSYVRLLAWEAASGWDTVNRFDSPVLKTAADRQRELARTGMELGLFRGDLDLQLVPTLFTSLPFFYFLYLPRLLHGLRPDVKVDELNEHARKLLADVQIRAIARNSLEGEPDFLDPPHSSV